MSTQGHPLNYQSNQASDDELAAIYLRDRDVPCPTCAYNRRGGHSSTCPECGSALTLIGIDAAQVSNFTKLARSVLGLIWKLALIQFVFYTYSIIRTAFWFVQLGTTRGLIPWAVFQTVSLIFWLSMFLVLLRRWRRTKRNEQLTSRTILSPIVAMVVFTFIQLAYSVINNHF